MRIVKIDHSPRGAGSLSHLSPCVSLLDGEVREVALSSGCYCEIHNDTLHIPFVEESEGELGHCKAQWSLSAGYQYRVWLDEGAKFEPPQ